MVKPITFTVTAEIVTKYAYTVAWPARTGYYYVPLYKAVLEGDGPDNLCQRHEFEVMRFGVKQDHKGDQARVTGLARAQIHTLQRIDAKIGACWRIYADHLVHSGSETPRLRGGSVGAVTGCVAVTGRSMRDKRYVNDWDFFEQKVLELSGTSDYAAITKAGSFKIIFHHAAWPELRPVRH